MAHSEVFTSSENLETWLDSSVIAIEEHIVYLEEELKKAEQAIFDDKEEKRNKGGAFSIDNDLEYKKNRIVSQITGLQDILLFIFDVYPQENEKIKSVAKGELSKLKQLKQIPENHTLNPSWISRYRSQNEKIINRITDQIHDITSVKVALLKDRINEEHISIFRHVRNRKPESLRDLVEVSIEPVLGQAMLTEEWIASFDRWLDLISLRYLDENFDNLVENKNKRKKKKKPEWRETFNESKFMVYWFDMTKQEFVALAQDALQDADQDVRNIFKTYPMSVKLQWKMVTIDPIQDISLVTKTPEIRNDSEYTVELWDNLGIIVFGMMDNLPITQPQLSGRLSKLEWLPGINPGDIISRKWNIFTIYKLWEEPYSFRIWPNNGNAMIV